MNPSQTAVILIDDDNDLLTEGGKLYAAVKPLLDSNRVIENINDLLGRAREMGLLVVHVPIVFSADYREMSPEPYGIFQIVKEMGAFQRGSWGAEVAEVLDVADTDIHIANKSATCAFATTDLKSVLDVRGIRHIALAGLLTNVCIESTMRSAYDRGFDVHTLTDCCATTGEEEQHAAMTYNWPMFSKPTDHQAFLKQANIRDRPRCPDK